MDVVVLNLCMSFVFIGDNNGQKKYFLIHDVRNISICLPQQVDNIL